QFWDAYLRVFRPYRPMSPWIPNSNIWQSRGGGINYDTEKDEWSYFYVAFNRPPTYVVMDSSNSKRVEPGERGPVATTVDKSPNSYRFEKLTHEDQEFESAVD